MVGSEDIKKYIKGTELFRSRPYLDPPNNKKGQYSTGYGHLIRPHEKHLMYKTLTHAEAEEIFNNDIAAFEKDVNRAITRPVNQNQFDAALDLAYNAGSGAANKVLNTWNNTGDSTAVADHIKRFNKASGVVHPGLVKRRQFDADLFTSGLISKAIAVTVDKSLYIVGGIILVVFLYFFIND